MSQNSSTKAKIPSTGSEGKPFEPIEGDIIESEVVVPEKQVPQLDGDYTVYRRLGFITLFVVFVLFGGWAALAPLNSSAVAIGEVSVVSNNRVVQHFEGGIVSEILVKEGSSVDQGDVLIRLSVTQVQAELSAITGRWYEMLGLEARLKAERNLESTLQFPENLLALKSGSHVSEILTSQTELFEARRKALQGELKLFSQRKTSLKEQISGLKSVIKSLDARIVSFTSEVADWEALYKDQFTDKIRIEELRRSLASLQGDRSAKISQVAGLELQIIETESQSLLRKKQFAESAVGELRQTQAERTDLENKIFALNDRLQRLEITSPVAGIVNGLSIFTIGEIIRPGVTLMEVVPNNREYAVKAKVATTDIDKVYLGLLADIRFSAFNTQTTHVVEGEVYHVSADKFYDDKTGLEYFEAKVRVTDYGVKQMEEDGLFLLPGMPAEVMIKTGERTLLGYFVKPFTNMFARSFNEE